MSFQSTRPIFNCVNDACQLRAGSERDSPKQLPCDKRLPRGSPQEPPRNRSHPEELAVARLYLLALRLHRGGIGLEQFQLRQWDVSPLLLHLRVERTMGETIDQQLLSLGAEEKTLEQPRGARIGRALEYAGGNDDQGRTFGGIHHLDRLALVLEQHQIVVVAVSHDRALAEQYLLRRIRRRLHLHHFLLRELFKIWPAQIARKHEGRGQDGAAVAGMTLDDLALPLRIQQV